LPSFIHRFCTLIENPPLLFAIFLLFNNERNLIHRDAIFYTWKVFYAKSYPRKKKLFKHHSTHFCCFSFLYVFLSMHLRTHVEIDDNESLRFQLFMSNFVHVERVEIFLILWNIYQIKLIAVFWTFLDFLKTNVNSNFSLKFRFSLMFSASCKYDWLLCSLQWWRQHTKITSMRSCKRVIFHCTQKVEVNEREKGTIFNVPVT
jgi:hypothetical protein